MIIKLGISGNETTLQAPSSFNIQDREISKKGRLSSGTLVQDIIAVKKVFNIGYDLLPGIELEKILNEYDRQTFLSFIYTDKDGVDQAYTVKFQPFNRSVLYDVGDWEWEGISFSLEEV